MPGLHLPDRARSDPWEESWPGPWGTKFRAGRMIRQVWGGAGAGEPRLEGGQSAEASSRPGLVGPIPADSALQLLSSLPSTQLVKPSHTESGSRQASWSQGNSSRAQLPGGRHRRSETPRPPPLWECLRGVGWTLGRELGARWESTHRAQEPQPGTRHGNRILAHCCRRRRPRGGGWCWC